MTVPPPNLEKVIIRNLLRKDLEEPGELNKYLEIKLLNFKADVYISFSAPLKTQSDICIFFFPLHHYDGLCNFESKSDVRG